MSAITVSLVRFRQLSYFAAQRPACAKKAEKTTSRAAKVAEKMCSEHSLGAKGRGGPGNGAYPCSNPTFSQTLCTNDQIFWTPEFAISL